MQTITFYSYKGGTGRSLALANAARYLARLEFKVVALDFDLEAPGLHYKFSATTEGKPLPVKAGILDYLHSFIVDGRIPNSLKDFIVEVPVPGADKPLIHLVPAGQVLAREYWTKLSRIDWHDLFYKKDAKGVQVFLELKSRILDELKPDFLLIDSRTGITEMGGVATTLLADKVICLVLPSLENLEGSRAVLRSLKRSKREAGSEGLEVVVAVSRLPEMRDSEREQDVVDSIQSILNAEADDLKDTLSCSQVFVLHSESALQLRESLRVGSGVSPDESILLRDYLRLFANIVPSAFIEPKVGKLIEQAKQKIWQDPEAALKEVEELAASFGHPDIYRELLRFYEVRNVGGTPALRRAQRLWDLSRDARDPILWQIVKRAFDPTTPTSRRDEWSPSREFLEAVWRNGGQRDVKFAMSLVTVYVRDDQETKAADILLEVIKNSGPSAEVIARCIPLLDTAGRATEADSLIDQWKVEFGSEREFTEAWARHALRTKSTDAIMELGQPPFVDVLRQGQPALAAQIYFTLGMRDEASALADRALQEAIIRGRASDLVPLGEIFHTLGRSDEFEGEIRRMMSPDMADRTIDESKMRRRRWLR